MSPYLSIYNPNKLHVKWRMLHEIKRLFFIHFSYQLFQLYPFFTSRIIWISLRNLGILLWNWNYNSVCISWLIIVYIISIICVFIIFIFIINKNIFALKKRFISSTRGNVQRVGHVSNFKTYKRVKAIKINVQ